jgi:hypothetical protein
MLAMLSGCGGGGGGNSRGGGGTAGTEPAITTQPASVSVTIGSTASFSVVATGTAPLSYQWSRGGTAISGATSASYTTAATVLADNGAVFTVMVSNSVGSVTSSAATLAVLPGMSSLLSGQYAFTFSGQNSVGPISIVGSFHADGKGSITGAVEDVTLVKKSNETIGAQSGITGTGTYSIGNDGRGTMTLNTSADGPQDFAFVIETSNHGQFIWFDNAATGSGSFDLQDTTAFAASTLNGSFVFGINGVDPALSTYSRVGVFSASSGSVSTGESDLNNAFGTGGVNLAQAISGGSVGAPDSGTGRGTLSLTYGSLSVKYAYYIVSTSQLNLIEADDNASVYGSATLQSGGPFTAGSLNGPYVFSTGGVNTVGGIGEVGQFMADGVSALSGVGDENFAGTPTQNYTLSGSFASVTANGRGTMELALPVFGGGSGPFVFYLASSGTVYLMEADVDEVTSGQALAQTGGPYTTASLTGGYGLQFSGADVNGVEVDFSGQITSGGSGALSSGTIDVNDEDQTAEPFFFSDTISAGAYTVTGSTTGRGTIGFNLGNSPLGFAYYFVSPAQIVLLETDATGQITLGGGQTQPTIP